MARKRIQWGDWPMRAALIAVLLPFAVPGVRDAAGWAGRRMAPRPSPTQGETENPLVAFASTLPRPDPLDTASTRRMAGRDDPAHERWCDIAGNFYSQAFISRFSYENTGPDGPDVQLAVAPSASTLRGKLEARRLKPNFAYQLKLMGDFRDRPAFEHIGYAGRWRLPGRATNYTDQDYADATDKSVVESYILFDYFVTDAHGNASVRFALDSSLHVLWNGLRQSVPDERSNRVQVYEIDASDRQNYARPKRGVTRELLWAEPEWARTGYSGRGVTRLPAGRYRAYLALTEESFHSRDADGGFWATPLVVPVDFIVEDESKNRSASRAKESPGE